MGNATAHRIVMRLKVLRKLGSLQELTSAAQRPLGQLHHHPHCTDPTVQGREGIRQRLAECRFLECLLSLLAAWSISLNRWAIVRTEGKAPNTNPCPGLPGADAGILTAHASISPFGRRRGIGGILRGRSHAVSQVTERRRRRWIERV